MTQDEIIEMARQAGLHLYVNDIIEKPYAEIVVAFANLVAAKALAQHDNVQAKPEPEQEPFAYVNVEKRRLEFAHDYVKWDTPTTIKLDKIPLYTTPPQRTWVGLTDEEMTHTNHHMVEGAYQYSFKQGALWAEAKLKEKNT